MTDKKIGQDLGAEFASDPQAMDAYLRHEAMTRLTAASEEDPVRPPSDDLLFDYLSGRLDGAAEETVRDWLVADVDVARRLEEMQVMASDVSGDATWETRLAWKDFQGRLPREGESRTKGWPSPAWSGLAAAVLLMVGGGVGWWMGSAPEGEEPRAVQAVTLQLLRDGGHALPAGRHVALSMPLNVSQGACDTLQWVLWRDGVETRRLALTPQDGQLHLYVPPLEPGAYRVDIEDCHGGRQVLEVQVEE